MTETTGFRIRPARLPMDAPALAQVYISSAEHHAQLDPGFYRVPDAGVVEERFVAANADAKSALLIAESRGVVVGYASLRMLPPPDAASMVAPVPTASIDLAVLPRMRSRGVGTWLLQEAESRARYLGARRIQLEVFAGNEGAVRLYRDRLEYRTMGLLLGKP